MKVLHAILLFSLAMIPTGRAVAQVDGAGTSLIIPLVSSSPSFTSEIYLSDQSGAGHSVSMKFYEAVTSPGGQHIWTCSPIPLAAFQTKTVTLAGQCAAAGLSAAVSHHGFVILDDLSVNKKQLFTASSRQFNPKKSGFTIEGYPIGHVGGGDSFSEVSGVKRVTGSLADPFNPPIQTNCFAATLDDPVTFSISIDVGTHDVTDPTTDTLGPFQMRRFLDIYSLAGAAPGDYQNTTVTFVKTDPNQWKNTLIAFCTVQDNIQSGADFRLSKNLNAADPSRFRANCVGLDSDGFSSCVTTPLATVHPTIDAAGQKARFLTRIYAPDVVNCALAGTESNVLQMQLSLFPPPRPVVAGGSNASSFTYNTGKRSAISGGFTELFLIEVSVRAGTSPAFPIDFGISCFAGNGMEEPIAVPADF